MFLTTFSTRVSVLSSKIHNEDDTPKDYTSRSNELSVSIFGRSKKSSEQKNAFLRNRQNYALHIEVSVQHKSIILVYNKPTRCNFGSIVSVRTVLFHGQIDHGIVQCTNDLEHLYWIYSIPTHDKHQWLLLQFVVLLMMDAKGVRNM